MKKIKFMYDFGASVWLEGDEGTDLFYEVKPEELDNDTELLSLMEEVNADYWGLYINTPIEFDYKGFDDEAHLKRFKDKACAFIELLREKTAGKYEFVLESNPESFTLED